MELFSGYDYPRVCDWPSWRNLLSNTPLTTRGIAIGQSYIVAYQDTIARSMGLAVGNSVAIGYSDNAQILNPGVAVAEWSIVGCATGSWSDSTEISAVIEVQAAALAQIKALVSSR